METTVRRGDIFYADLSPVVGSEQGGTRPVLIVQNDTGNKHSPTVIAAAITSQTGKARLPTHINIAGGSVGLTKDSIILLEQIRTIDAASPMPTALSTDVETARVGQVPRTNRRTGFSSRKPFVSSLPRDFFSAIIYPLLLLF